MFRKEITEQKKYYPTPIYFKVEYLFIHKLNIKAYLPLQNEEHIIKSIIEKQQLVSELFELISNILKISYSITYCNL